MRRPPPHLAALLAALKECGGITDEAALVEAQRDYLQIADLIRADLRAALQLAGDKDPWPYVRALYDDAVVIEHGAKLWRYPYTVSDEGGKATLKLGTRTEVVTAFVPATAIVTEAAADGVFLEAEADGDKPARRFKVRVIKAGMSLNNNFYPDAVLKEAVGLFNGVRVFAKSDADHLRSAGKDVRNLIGQLTEAAFVPGPVPDSGEIQAVMTLINPAADIAVTIREAVATKMSGLFGLSIDAPAKVARRKVDGVTITEARKLLKIRSVDLIVDAGAGGAVLDLAEAAAPEHEDDMTRAQLIAKIKARRPALLAGMDEATLTEAQLEALLDEVLTEAAPPAGDSAAVVALIEARQSVRDRVGRSGLPEQARAKVATALLARDDVASLTEAQIEDAIKAEQSYLTGLGLGGGQVLDLGPSARIEGGESRREKVATMLEAFFDPAHKDHRHAGSIKDIYLDITGDRRFTGRLRECDDARLREALGSDSWADALGDTINRRMLADYKQQTAIAGWRPLVNVTRISDFRTQERVRVGGYGAIPTVAERAPYLELPSPSDEKAEYAVEKRGGLESISLEMIRNDDVSAIRQIPTKLSRAANRTLAKFVFDFFKNNAAIYDGTALFHVSRGNLGTAALDKDSWDAARVGLITRTKFGEEEDTVGVGPKFLLVSPYQTRKAEDLFVRSTNLDADYVQRTRPVVVEVWYWTDANDWVALADPMDVPGIEIGFLDGQEEPELFVQDAPNNGSMFFNDTVTWKLRHIYGGAVCDWRPFYKAVVA